MQSWIPFPDSASTFSGQVDALYLYLVGVTIFFVVLIGAVIVFFVIRYRRQLPFEIPRPVAGSLKLESLWTVIPFFIAMSMFVWGASVLVLQYHVPKDAMEVYVVGKQWMWKFQHLTGQREINELHVPVGRRIKLVMTTEDVIHSFYVPAFRTKSDVVPGRYTYIWFEATKPGRYHLFCAEYCGTNHSGMGGWINVMEPADYDNWLSGNANQESPVAAGQRLFTQTLGCASCHKEDGSGGRGPALTGLLGSTVQLEGGQAVVANEDYIRESIINPRAKLVRGFQPIMPTFQGQVSEEQLLQLLSYIKSLSPGKTSGIDATSPARSNNAQTGGATPEATGAATTTTPATASGGTTPAGAQRSNPAGASSGNSNRPR
jgi:cytochrome c oxidase subunit 2